MIERLLDPYDRKARLYPALLAMLVPVIVALLIVPTLSNHIINLTYLAGAFGAFMLLNSIGRERGKRIEPHLFERWGGTPTTQLLLLTRSSLDHLTLKRYRQFFQKRIHGISFPDVDGEYSDYKHASAVCESSVKWLREITVYSGPKRTPNTATSGHPFRPYPDTDYGTIRTVITG